MHIILQFVTRRGEWNFYNTSRLRTNKNSGQTFSQMVQHTAKIYVRWWQVDSKSIRGLKTISEFICQKLYKKAIFLFTFLLPKAKLYLFWISLWHIKRQPHSLTINTAARCWYFQKMFVIYKTDLVWNKHFPPKMNSRL